MIDGFKTMLGQVLGRLSQELKTDVPNVLAALVILLIGVLMARMARWLVARALRTVDLNGRVRESGLSAALGSRETLNASRIATQGVYLAIVAIAALAAFRVIGAQLAAGMMSAMASLAPRLAGGAAIVVAGMWLGLYLSRSVLIWAVNEDLPAPRKLAIAARVLIVFAALAVAADVVNLGGGLFRAVFLVILGGLVLSASLAVGLGSRDVVRSYLEERIEQSRERNGQPEDQRLWNHL